MAKPNNVGPSRGRQIADGVIVSTVVTGFIAGASSLGNYLGGKYMQWRKKRAQAAQRVAQKKTKKKTKKKTAKKR